MSIRSCIKLDYSAPRLIVLMVACAVAAVFFHYGRIGWSEPAPCAQNVIFAPQPDITPYELAQLQTKVASLGLQICVAANDPIPPEMARHFRAVPQ